MKAKIDQLRKELHQHAHDYYVLARPTITDEKYDQLFKELQRLEALCPEFADPNSPTTRIGGASIDTFEKVKHSVPMLSLDNTFSGVLQKQGASHIVATTESVLERRRGAKDRWAVHVVDVRKRSLGQGRYAWRWVRG